MPLQSLDKPLARSAVDSGLRKDPPLHIVSAPLSAADSCCVVVAAMQTTFSNGWGGGISSHNVTITLEDVLFDQCVSGESGGAIQTAMSNVTINRMTCRDTSSSVRPLNTLALGKHETCSCCQVV